MSLFLISQQQQQQQQQSESQKLRPPDARNGGRRRRRRRRSLCRPLSSSSSSSSTCPKMERRCRSRMTARRQAEPLIAGPKARPPVCQHLRRAAVTECGRDLSPRPPRWFRRSWAHRTDAPVESAIHHRRRTEISPFSPPPKKNRGGSGGGGDAFRASD